MKGKIRHESFIHIDMTEEEAADIVICLQPLANEGRFTRSDITMRLLVELENRLSEIEGMG